MTTIIMSQTAEYMVNRIKSPEKMVLLQEFFSLFTPISLGETFYLKKEEHYE